MTDLKKLIGQRDVTGELLSKVREEIGESPYWDEIEPALYDTIKEFEQAPDLNERLQLPGIERLTDAEREVIGKAVSEFAKKYGKKCHEALLLPLAVARARLVLATKKYEP